MHRRLPGGSTVRASHIAAIAAARLRHRYGYGRWGRRVSLSQGREGMGRKGASIRGLAESELRRPGLIALLLALGALGLAVVGLATTASTASARTLTPWTAHHRRRPRLHSTGPRPLGRFTACQGLH